MSEPVSRGELDRILAQFKKVNYSGPKIEIEANLNSLKLNECMLYAIQSAVSVTAYDMFEYFNNLAQKSLQLFKTKTYAGRKEFRFYGVYPGTNVNFSILIKQTEFNWNTNLIGIDKDGKSIINYREKFPWPSSRLPVEQEDVVSYKKIYNFDVVVSVPGRSIVFNADKIAEISVEKELLGFSALKEPEDPKTIGSRRSIDDLDKMILETQTESKDLGNKEIEDVE